MEDQARQPTYTMAAVLTWIDHANAVCDEPKLESNDEPPMCRVKSSPAALASVSQCTSSSTLSQPTQELCPICCDTVDELHCMETYAGGFHSACACTACINCISKWVETQLHACALAYSLRVQCFGCKKTMPQYIVLKASEGARTLAQRLERREVLQANKLYPGSLQVNCRQVGCVGIGYLGYETIMCMICEDQWDATEDSVGGLRIQHGLDADGLLTYTNAAGGTNVVKPCPACKTPIDKNGGCDHMRCASCKHEFWWSTLKPYR